MEIFEEIRLKYSLIDASYEFYVCTIEVLL